MQPVVLGEPGVITRTGSIPRVHEQVDPLVMQQCDKPGEPDCGADRPSLRYDARRQADQGKADQRKACNSSSHRSDNRQARTDCIRPAQQQPVHVIRITVVSLMSGTRAQQFGQRRAGLSMQQPTVDHPLHRAECNDDREHRKRITERPVAQCQSDDSRQTSRNDNHPTRRRSGEGTGRSAERGDVPSTMHDHHGTSGAPCAHIGPLRRQTQFLTRTASDSVAGGLMLPPPSGVQSPA